MPRREDKTAALKELNRLRAKLEARLTEEWYLSLTGRILYEMDTINLMNQTIVDRPTNLALGNVTINVTDGKGKKKDKKKTEIKSLDPVTVMTDCMVDGRVVIRIRNGWTDLEVEDNKNVAELKIDGEGFVSFIRIQYQIVDDKGKPGLWFRRDYEKRDNAIDESGKVVTVFVRIDWPRVKKVKDFDKVTPDELTVTEIPFIPFVAQVWNPAQESFLIKKRRALLEMERVSIEITGENVKHSRRKLFVKAPVNVEVEVADLGDDINQLTEEGDAFYPDPHAAVINGFFKERNDQKEAIENATGVVATEKIVALSGVSRVTAMKSLVDLAQKIRKKFIDLMIQIETLFHDQDIDKRQLLVLLPPLGMMIVDVNNQDVLLKEAHEDEHISDYEFRESRRQMLGL